VNTPQTSRRAEEHWSQEVDAVRAELEAADRRVRTLARTQPLTMIALALAAGFVVGRIVRG
jgi:phytoene/squalene synthetase